MPQLLTTEQRTDFLSRGFSRRNFGRIASLITAGAALPFYNERAMAQLSMVKDLPPDAVKINANENPMGPCPEAADAMYNVIRKGGRYMYEETFALGSTMAEVEDLKPDHVMPFAGSSDPLHRAVLAYTSPAKPYVVADPGYEAGGRAAEFAGAAVIKVPLVKGSAIHDVKAMAAAHHTPGLIYVCNPNNPTGTVTPKADIDWLIENKPAGSILLIDEAYIHLSKDAVSNSPHVAAGKEIIVLRTFSKLYGMAGLRAGAALGRPDLLKPMIKYSAGALPVTAMVGANASLKANGLVAMRRKAIAGIREEVSGFLSKNDIEFIPSDANMIMMNAKRPGKEFFAEMAKEKVYIGRVWPVWPDWVRVTVGTREDMKKFQTACLKVYNS